MNELALPALNRVPGAYHMWNKWLHTALQTCFYLHDHPHLCYFSDLPPGCMSKSKSIFLTELLLQQSSVYTLLNPVLSPEHPRIWTVPKNPLMT